MMEEETVKPMTAEEYLIAYNTGYQAGLSKAQRDADDAFWLRQYAGQAMQGILANGDRIDDEDGYLPSAKAVITNMSVRYAKALLEDVKKHERS